MEQKRAGACMDAKMRRLRSKTGSGSSAFSAWRRLSDLPSGEQLFITCGFFFSVISYGRTMMDDGGQAHIPFAFQMVALAGETPPPRAGTVTARFHCPGSRCVRPGTRLC